MLEVVGGGAGRPRLLRFNKRYNEWLSDRPLNRVQSHESTVRELEDALSANLGTEVSANLGTNKERKKTLKKTMSESNIYEQIIGYLIRVIDIFAGL